MVQIPVKFKRVAAAFDEMSRFRSCDSSGSEHSADLSDLVNSFFEREIREQRLTEDCGKGINEIEDYDDDDDDESDFLSNSPDFELQDSVRNLFESGRDDDEVKRSIYTEVEKAVEGVSCDGSSSPEFKRQLMARLRSSGFDAGLCKSKWEKKGSTTSGNYEYVDVNAGGARYIVEVFLGGEFKIARPTGCYASLLEVFPRIYVGKPEEVKKVVRIMSRAIRKSLRSVELKVPPWRRLEYMQSKWLGSYKRTVNEIPSGKSYKELDGERLVGFSTANAPAINSFICRDDFDVIVRRGGRVIGNLAAAFNQKEIIL